MGRSGGRDQRPKRHLPIIADVAVAPCARLPVAITACGGFASFNGWGQIWLACLDVPVFLVGLSVFPHYHTEKPAKKELGLVQITRPRENALP